MLLTSDPVWGAGRPDLRDAPLSNPDSTLPGKFPKISGILEIPTIRAICGLHWGCEMANELRGSELVLIGDVAPSLAELLHMGVGTSPGLERGPVGEGLPERAVMSQEVWGGTAHTMLDGRTLIVPDWAYEASRDKASEPWLDVWGEPLSLGRPKPVWPAKQRVGLYLPE